MYIYIYIWILSANRFLFSSLPSSTSSSSSKQGCNVTVLSKLFLSFSMVEASSWHFFELMILGGFWVLSEWWAIDYAGGWWVLRGWWATNFVGGFFVGGELLISSIISSIVSLVVWHWGVVHHRQWFWWVVQKYQVSLSSIWEFPFQSCLRMISRFCKLIDWGVFQPKATFYFSPKKTGLMT